VRARARSCAHNVRGVGERDGDLIRSGQFGHAKERALASAATPARAARKHHACEGGSMYASALRIPQVPVALIPLIDTLLETVRTEPPHRHSGQELAAMCHGVACRGRVRGGSPNYAEAVAGCGGGACPRRGAARD
jgi:hypothetical protein